MGLQAARKEAVSTLTDILVCLGVAGVCTLIACGRLIVALLLFGRGLIRTILSLVMSK